MTREAFSPSPSYPISGTGPYQITHPYKEGTLVVAAVLDGSRVELLESEYSISPVDSLSTGEISLTSQAASDYEAGALYIRRATEVEQGWLGQSAREKGLEAQLDWLAEAVQDLTVDAKRAVRLDAPLAPVTPKVGHVLFWTEDEQFEPGPSVGDIANAESNAQLASMAAGQSVDAASEAKSFRDEAARYDGPKVDVFAELADVAQAVTGTLLRVIETGAIVEAEDGTVDLDYSGTGGGKWNVRPRADGWYHPVDFGLTGVGDETAKLLRMAQRVSDRGGKIKWPDVEYEFSEMDLNGAHIWDGFKLRSNKTATVGGGADFAVSFGSTYIGETTLATNAKVGDNVITVADASPIQVGDVLHLQSTRLIPTDHRGLWHEGQMFKVMSITGNNVRLSDTLVYSARANDATTGTITAISPDRYTVTLSNMLADTDLRNIRRRLRITDGTAAGQERWIVSTAGDDATHLNDWGREPWPAELQVGDAYSYEWLTEVNIYRPKKITLTNGSLCRDRVFDATGGDIPFGGIYARGYDFEMRGCIVDGFPRENVKTQYSYAPRMKDCDLLYANMAYDGGKGNGYGWSVEACHRPKAINVRGHANRRTVDFSGAGGYTTFGLCLNVTNVGGGRAYTGDPFWPAGDVLQNVAGSHGSGYQSRYINCEGHDVAGGINLRGQREVVRGYDGYGSAIYLAQMFGGGFGAEFIDLSYHDEFNSQVGSDYNPEKILTKRLTQAVNIKVQGDYVWSVPCVVRGVRASTLTRAVVNVEMAGTSEIANLHISGTNVICDPSDSGQTDFRVLFPSADVSLYDCTLENNYFQEVGNYSGSAALISIGDIGSSGASCDIKSGERCKIDGSWYVNVPPNSLARLPLGMAKPTAQVNLHDVRDGTTRPFCYGVLMQDMSATDVNAGSVKQNVELLAVYPMSATDATAGFLGMNLNKVAGFLTLVNNTAFGKTCLVDVK